MQLEIIFLKINGGFIMVNFSNEELKQLIDMISPLLEEYQQRVSLLEDLIDEFNTELQARRV